MNDDATLLQEFARNGSEPAFRELVGRYIQLVNSAALRRVAGDVHLAQDVTQTVFTNLARKAAALPSDVVLGGWLHRDTCYTAVKAVRAESRRRARERTAMEINALNENSAHDAQWQQIAPVLDDALNRLSTRDRNAIVLRYLQGCDVHSVGDALGSSENAAQIRLGRALEKLRAFFTRRGITLTAALLATALDAGARTVVPSGLSASVSATALTGAVGSTFTLTSLSLYNLMTSKLALSATAVLALTGLVTVLVAQNEPTTPTTTVAVSNPVPAQQAAVPATAPAAPQPSVTSTPPSSSTDATTANSPPMRRSSGISRSIFVGTSPSTVAVGVSGQSGGSLTLNPDGSGGVTLTKTENGVTTTETIPAPAAGTNTTGFSTGGNNGGGMNSGFTTATSGTVSSGVSTGSGASSGSTSQSVAVNSADGTMTVTTNNNGVVNTQTTPITGGSGTSGSTSSATDGRTGQTVTTFTDANGMTQTVITPAPSTGSAQ